jgi:hypothetical protein
MAKANGYSLTQGEYAARRGITQPAVAKLIRQGKLEGAFKREGRRYKINPQKADAILATLERPAPAQKQNQDRPAPIIQADTVATGADASQLLAGGLVTFAEACRREKAAKAALLELKLKREKGELIERQRVEEVAAKLATLVRVGVESIPAKVAPTVAGLKRPGDIARLLQGHIREVLDNLSKGIADLDF